MITLPKNPKLEDLPEATLIAMRNEALIDPGHEKFGKAIDDELKSRNTPQRRRHYPGD